MAYAEYKGLEGLSQGLNTGLQNYFLDLQHQRDLENQRQREEDILTRTGIADIYKKRALEGGLNIQEDVLRPQLPEVKPSLASVLTGAQETPVPTAQMAFPPQLQESQPEMQTISREPGLTDVQQTLQEIYGGKPISQDITGLTERPKTQGQEIYFIDPKTKQVHDIEGNRVMGNLPENAKIITSTKSEKYIDPFTQTLNRQKIADKVDSLSEEIVKTKLFKERKEKGKDTWFGLGHRDLNAEELFQLKEELKITDIPEEQKNLYYEAAKKKAIGDIKGYEAEMERINMLEENKQENYEFNSVEEAEKADLPKGTIVTIKGKKARVE